MLYLYPVKWLFYLLIILILPYKAIAQQPAYFLFGEKEFEGIDIYNLIQDNDLNYWFATDQGIIKHDGYTFKSIECDEMKSNSVFNFIKDKSGNIYCHNLNHQIFKISNGVCRLFYEIHEKGRGADVYLKLTNSDELMVVSKEAYILNKQGEVMVSTEQLEHNYLGAPFLLKNGTIIFSKSDPKYLLTYKNGNFSEIIFQDEGFLGSQNSVLEFHRIRNETYAINTFTKDFFRFNEDDFSLTKVVHPISLNQNEYARFYDLDDKLWVASNINGVSVLDDQLSALEFPNKLFEDYFISNVYKDIEGNTLLSTFDKGIIVIPNIRIQDVLPELKGIRVTRILSDENKCTYLGTNDGKVFRMDGKYPTIISSTGNKTIETLYKWPRKPLLLTDKSGLTIINTQTKKETVFSDFSFKCAELSSDNTLFIGTNLGIGILDFNETTGNINYNAISGLEGRCYAMKCDPRSSHVYIATTDGIKIKSKKDKIELLKINDTIVYASAMACSSNYVYIASNKHGLLLVSKGKVVKQLFPIHKNEVVKFYKLQIRKSKIYANTSIGLIVLDLKGKVLYLMNKSAGLETNKITDFDIKGNTIWVTHARGLQIIDLKKVNATLRKPRLMISKIEVNNQSISEKNEFLFSENKFAFTFRVSTLRNRENIFYHFRLLPTDTNWTISEYNDHKVVYNALEPGTYTFVVKAENNGVFSKSITYTFTINKPFYLTWWFITCMVIFTLLTIQFFYRRALRKEQLKSQQLNELNASKLTAIQSQMNPHFIFNSLNSIQDLVLKGDVTNSYTFITKFSNLVRRTLNYSDKDFIDFDQEIKLLELYLSLEKLRFKESLEFTLETNEIDDIQVPPMLIQPFIENALLHGLLHKEGLKKLKIEFRLEETLICEITDNGIGREKSKEIKERQRSEHESFAIGAIKKRFEILEKHFEGELGFEYFDLKNGENILGTKVVLRIPIKHKF